VTVVNAHEMTLRVFHSTSMRFRVGWYLMRQQEMCVILARFVLTGFT
jgi:hypothetical protein